MLALVLVVAGIAAALLLRDDDGGPTANAADSREPAGSGAPDTATSDCPAPAFEAVDTEADDAARCLAGQFDQWAAQGLMAVGQQVTWTTTSGPGR